MSCPGGSWAHRPCLPLTLTCWASPELPEQGPSLGLLEEPLALSPFLSSCPFLFTRFSLLQFSHSVFFWCVCYPKAHAALLPHALHSCRHPPVSPSAWPWDLCPTPTPPCSTLAYLDVRVGGLPAPTYPESWLSAHHSVCCLFQVQLYVWHMLPLGKDLLHRIPALLQAGMCSQQLPGSSCKLGTRSQGLCLGAGSSSCRSSWLTEWQRQA